MACLKATFERGLVASSLMLAACDPIHKAIGYRYGVLQDRHKPSIPGRKNQLLSPDNSQLALDNTNVANPTECALHNGIDRQAKPSNSDLLATKEIQLFSDHTFGVWHSSLPETTP